MAKVEIEEEDLRQLIEQSERDLQMLREKENDIIIMYKSIAGILHVIGLSDGVKIDPLVFKGDGIYGKIAKGGGSLIALMMQSKVPGFQKITQIEIDKKFHFLQDMAPVLDKYNEIFDNNKLLLQSPAEIKMLPEKPTEPIQLKHE